MKWGFFLEFFCWDGLPLWRWGVPGVQIVGSQFDEVKSVPTLWRNVPFQQKNLMIFVETQHIAPIMGKKGVLVQLRFELFSINMSAWIWVETQVFDSLWHLWARVDMCRRQVSSGRVCCMTWEVLFRWSPASLITAEGGCRQSREEVSTLQAGKPITTSPLLS